VSEDPAHGASTIKAAKNPGGGGGAGKWLLGGLAAVVLAGGGYAAWKTFGSGQDNAQSAYNDTYSDTYADGSQRAGQVESGNDLTAESASTNDSDVAPAASAPRSAARRSTARAEDVPEETIGVTPASYSTESDSDEIVVQGSRRPVWVRTPSERRLTSLYPARALERGREGEARLHCTVEERGTLDCVRVEETPGGFGTAAMRVANTLRHAPTRRDGTDATGTPVNLRVVFRLDENERRRG
jgi:TonB family protein